MATYIALANFTDKGIGSVRDTTKRADAVKEMASKYGVTMKDIYWTLGKYDIVTICEAKDEASITAFGLALGEAGNVRTQTLRAFTKDEMNGVLGKMK